MLREVFVFVIVTVFSSSFFFVFFLLCLSRTKDGGHNSEGERVGDDSRAGEAADDALIAQFRINCAIETRRSRSRSNARSSSASLTLSELRE